MTDITKVFIAQDGYGFNDSDGNVLTGMFSGTTNPSSGLGSPAPVGSLFLQTNGTLFIKSSAPDVDWLEMVRTDDGRLNPAETVTVQKNPGPGEFSSIFAAVASISGASASTPYLVRVYPGVYTEPAIVIPQYVSIDAQKDITVEVLPVDPSQDTFTLSANTSLRGISVSGVTSGRGVVIEDATLAFISDLIFINNQTDIFIQGNTTPTIVVANNMVHTGGPSQLFGVRVSTTAGTSVLLKYTTGTAVLQGSISLNSFFEATGTGTKVLILDANFAGSGFNGTGVTVSDGAVVSSNSSTISEFSTGLHVANIGAAPIIFFNAQILMNYPLTCVQIDHPGTTGFFSGGADHNGIFVVPNTPVSFAYNGINDTPPENVGFSVVGSLLMGAQHSFLTDVTDLIQQASATGVLQGGSITSTGGLNISVATGYGYMVDSGTLREKRAAWVTSPLLLPNNTESYIYVDQTFTVTFAASPPDLSESIFLGRVRTLGGTVNFISQIPLSANASATFLDQFLRSAIGAIFGSGCTVTENVTPFEVDVTAGQYYYSKLSFLPSAASPATFDAYFHVAGVFTQTFGNTIVDNTQYDNGTNLTPLSPGFYTKHSFYVAGEGVDQVFSLVYGQAQYATLLEAQTAPLPVVPPDFLDIVIPIAALIVQEGALNISEIFDIRPRLGFVTPAITGSIKHGDLTGLLNDDHPQYLLVSGTRAMTGNLEMNTNNIHLHQLELTGGYPDSLIVWDYNLPSAPPDNFGYMYGRAFSSVANLGIWPHCQAGNSSANNDVNMIREEIRNAANSTGLLMTRGQMVYTNGAGIQPATPNVALAKADLITTATVFGMVWTPTGIAAGGIGLVISSGTIFNIDTTAYSLGDILYLSETTAGALRVGPPPFPNVSIKIGTVTQVGLTDGAIVLEVQPAFNPSGITVQLNGITAATGPNTISNGDNAQTWNWALTTAAKSAFKFGESAAGINGVGAQFLVDIETLATSTTDPFRVVVRGVENFKISRTGEWLVNSSAGTLGQVLVSGGAGTNPSWSNTTTISAVGTIVTGVWNGTIIGTTFGGTGLSSYAQGDLIYASAVNTLTTLPKDTNATRYLSNTGATNNPAWAQVNLTNGVTGSLPLVNGGTGQISGLLLNNILSATGANSINSGDNAQAWNWSLTTAAKAAFSIKENIAGTNGAGAQYLLDVETLATSTTDPFRVVNRGVENFKISRTGEWLVNSSAGTTGQVLTSGGPGTNPSWSSTTAITVPLSSLTAAVTANSINNGDNAQTWNWALTTAAKSAFAFTENIAATAGAGSQFLVDIGTIAASTANPIRIRAQGNNVLTVTNVGVTTLQGTDTATGSAITIRGGNSATAATNGGAATLQGGSSATTGIGGQVNVIGGLGDTTGTGGLVQITGGGGGTVSGNAGGVTITGGTPVSGTGGSISISGSAGVGTNQPGGSITESGGNATGNAAGGAYSLTGGSTATGNAGSVSITGGTATAAGIAGSINLIAGASTGGSNGSIILATTATQTIYRNGNFTTAGDAQSSVYILRAQTTNATVTTLFLDGTGGAARLVLPSNSAWTFDILVTARNTGAAQAAGYRFVGVIRRTVTAASTTLVGSSKTVIAEDNAAWDANIVADTTNGALQITVTGVAATTIDWVAVVKTAEVHF